MEWQPFGSIVQHSSLREQPFMKRLCTIKIQNVWTDMSEQTVQTLIRLLLQEQPDQGLLCLQVHLHL